MRAIRRSVRMSKYDEISPAASEQAGDIPGSCSPLTDLLLQHK
jgi:hypothetical protein